MIIRVYSHKDCVAINTDRIDSISVDYTLDLKTRRFARNVAVIFNMSNSENSEVIFAIDIDSESYKIYTTDEILNLKKCVIDYITNSIYMGAKSIDIIKIVEHALNETLLNMERVIDNESK